MNYANTKRKGTFVLYWYSEIAHTFETFINFNKDIAIHSVLG